MTEAMSGAEREGEAGSEPREQQAAAVRHEEELELGTQEYEAGTVRARKRIEKERIEWVEPRSVESGDFERAPAAEGDSGEIETLADGSVSIPLFEERLVVSKELVVRERVIVRKRTVTEQQRIEAELRKEHIEIEGDLEEEQGAGTATGDSREEERRNRKE
jgi:uncharacterized protein (TIGR02271 family)